MTNEFQDAKNSLLHQILSSSYEIEGDSSDEFAQEGGLTNEEHRLILMHRDVHFSSSFPAMIEYYKQNGKGAVLDVFDEDIVALYEEEKRLQKDLSPFLLSGADAEKVKAAKKMYKELAELAEKKDQPLASCIANLILTESEDATEEIQAIVKFGRAALQPLVDVIFSDTLNDPLFPGYGLAPLYAIRALEKLKCKESIEPLFMYACQKNPFFEAASKALVAIGLQAQEFLMRIVKSNQPVHIQACAAMILLEFNENLAPFFFETLKNKSTALPLAVYCAIGCAGLQGKQLEECRHFVETARLLPEVREELLQIFKNL